MTKPIKSLVPLGISHETPAVCLTKLSSADRLKHHRKELRSIAFLRGIEGATEYKQAHPDASSIRVNIDTLAYSPKPKGYDQYLAKSVEAWLTSDAALASTNIADVTALNEHFDTNRFNPANHFSKPLSAARLNKLKALFLEHGSDLDTATHNTLSKVKAAAKAARGHRSSDKPFSNVGTIAGNQLVIGNSAILIAKHNGYDCIRIRVNAERVRLRLDALEGFFDLLSGRAVEDDPLLSITLCNIGERAPATENVAFGYLAHAESSGCDYSPIIEKGERAPDTLKPMILQPIIVGGEKGELAPDAQPLSLTDRIAALKAALPSYSTPCPDGVDPLTLD